MSKTVKILSLIAVVLFIAVIVVAVYRTFFQFKNSSVNAYIQQEANKYETPVQTAKILTDAVHHILGSRGLTNEVLDYAKLTGVEKEQVLVSAALSQAKSYGYIG